MTINGPQSFVMQIYSMARSSLVLRWGDSTGWDTLFTNSISSAWKAIRTEVFWSTRFRPMKFVFLLFFYLLQASSSPVLQEQDWFAKARQYFEKQEWGKAQQAATKALEINPRLAEAEILLGLIATARQQPREAEPQFERAVSLRPR